MLWDFSLDAADNGDVDASINFQEGQAPSTLNDSNRALMARLKAFAVSLSGGVTYAGSANAYTAANPTGHEWEALPSSFLFALKANHTNNGAATLNIDGLGAKAIKTADGGDVASGDLVSGGIYLLAYDGTNLQVISPLAGGDFQPRDADLTSWAAVTRATGFDTFAATPTSANLRATLTDETGTGLAMFNNSPSIVDLLSISGSNGGIQFANRSTGSLPFTVYEHDDVLRFFANTADRFSFSAAGAFNAAGAITANGVTVLTTATGAQLSGASFTGAALAANGLVGTPGLAFVNDPDCGYYRIGTNNIGLSIAGSKQVDYSATATEFTQGDLRILATASVQAVNSAGFRGLGRVEQRNASSAFVLTDNGQNVYHDSGTHSWTIPPFSSVEFPEGGAVSLVNFAGTLTIVPGSGVTIFILDGSGALNTSASISIPVAGMGMIARFPDAGANNWIYRGDKA